MLPKPTPCFASGSYGDVGLHFISNEPSSHYCCGQNQQLFLLMQRGTCSAGQENRSWMPREARRGAADRQWEAYIRMGVGRTVGKCLVSFSGQDGKSPAELDLTEESGTNLEHKVCQLHLVACSVAEYQHLWFFIYKP